MTRSSRAHHLLLASLLLAAGPAHAAAGQDATAAALDRCLAEPTHMSTGDQTDCETVAARSYDRRMNMAYEALIRRLPPDAVRKLRESQRDWLTFRDAETKAREAIYATRHGTMFVPWESDDAVKVVRDRALLLEGYLRAMEIE